MHSKESCDSSSNAGSRDTFGSFLIDDTEFALSADSIQEVVHEPHSYTEVPLSPDYLLGMFNLRGLVVPVVDLRKIFKLEAASDEIAEKKIAIIEHGVLCLGLLFDGTSEVFNGDDAVRSQFSRRSGGATEAIVEGVFKFDNGRRMVQILDPHELLNLEKVPRSENHSKSQIGTRKNGKRRQCISFKLGDCCCAFDMESIKEIVEIDKIHRTALTHECSVGAINIRGNTIPLIDFGYFLGRKDKTSINDVTNSSSKVILMRLEHGTLGLIVDSIDNIISYYNDDVVKFPMLGIDRNGIFKGSLIQDPDRMIILLNQQELFLDSEIDAIVRGHSNLYADALNHKAETAINTSGQRKTFITFSIEREYAFEIDQANEIIDYPDNIVRPPNLPRAIDGMVNLRGELIPIINPRSLYDMPEISLRDAKIMIFSINDNKYGLTVDSVDSIVTLTDHDGMKIPNIATSGVKGPISDDIKEALRVSAIGQEDRVLMMLDLPALLLKIFPGDTVATKATTPLC